MDGVGMDERDLEPVEPAPRGRVDQLRTGLRELTHGRRHIVCLERDVVHARPATSEEAADRSVLAGREEELDAAVADEQRGGLDTLFGERVPMLHRRAEEALVGRDRLVEIGDGDADVMDSAQGHARDASGVRQSRMGRARTVPTVSDDRDSTFTSASRASSSARSSVSFSSSASATRSSEARCFTSSRCASS
jgi:hypothetical protein